ncbi:unannotated protein [freshwater metagenome]|uniref:Unannotated protein n=1 Tax=freshwater metagenome TaxID=449393 RepID=A0A6J6LYZ6_9ZZZZ
MNALASGTSRTVPALSDLVVALTIGGTIVGIEWPGD